MASWLDALKTRQLRRVAVIALVFFFSTTLLLVLVRLDAGSRLLELGKGAFGGNTETIQTCAFSNQTWGPVRLKPIEAKYENLLDDKFTIAMQTYQRPVELNDTLRALLSEEIPSLLEVVIVWNDLNESPPDNFVSEHGVPVRFRASLHNSLNEKLWPDPEYRTKAILLSDDDVYYHPKDLEFVFQSWRKFGQNRLTGALARCSSISPKGGWEYTFCSNNEAEDVYSMILTNLAFAPISFLDFYSSDDPAMIQVRNYVDKHFNCEDIGLNYMASMITRSGPLLVQGHETYFNSVPSKGISTKPGHLKARSRCLNDFAEIFRCMPLVNETAHIQRGVIVL
ncbi:Fc.00g000830.m01.CDS01 [Cosmosporella sp. VM-42]